MEARTLDEIRQAVAIHAPTKLAVYDDLTSKPLRAPGMTLPIDWTLEMRRGLLLDIIWLQCDHTRPN